MYRFSTSSSSLTNGISIGSVSRLKESIVPLVSWLAIIKKTIKPKRETKSWSDTFKELK